MTLTYPREFIIDLPSAYELGFDVATPQYATLEKRAVVFGLDEEFVVSRYLFRIFRDKCVPKRIIAALRDHSGGSLESFAFSVPINLNPIILAEEIRRKRHRIDADKLAGWLIEFYRKWKER